MRTRILAADDAGLSVAADLIIEGLPVAVPTETVYGLAADASNPSAVARIYAAKGRPSFNPLIVHVRDLAHARQFGQFDEAAVALAARHWPGPLTLVVPAVPTNDIASLATAGLSTIALRVSAHPAMLALIERSERPLAAPSANSSGSLSPTRPEHVRRSLGGRIPLILDDGPTAGGLESTIIAVTGGTPRLLRPGMIAWNAGAEHAAAIEAPGQLDKHYAPGRPLRLNATERRGDEYLIGFGGISGDTTLSATGNLQEAATRLFAALHDAQASGRARIAVAPIPSQNLGIAINDRLKRAAA